MNAEAGVALVALVVAVGVAVVGWVHAHRADRRIADANRIAADALDLARSAEARADRLEQMASERRDVAWDAALDPDSGWLHVRNIGSDTAHDVEVVTVPAEPAASRRIERVEQAAPDDVVRVDVSDLYAASVERTKVLRSRGVLPSRPGVNFRTVRVTWRSPAGAPSTEAWEDREYFGR